ncbi:succinate dehydrogenase/fumarate reductase iron-sulfur subunit [Corynebacterium pseudopelargi]|uniref:Succinate dehydrogenase/fumarate reductase iron-sulfur subunit n=1 Tax=Corynebacterium pseudopelargi TaxID=2080757 RepID=A0A3G6IS19_9CORY|nr:heterodisulfide reductase-related iron-sulfur binding cluster [Corynebacterium pseudopelargi]AZA08366.1 succinate dehydrogenase/fumarate reductase iron-sulfur subunit [Corynebacterium pseudopelargi]
MQTTLGIIGIVLSLPAWGMFIAAVARLYRLIGSGRPSPGRSDQPLRRLAVMLKEVFFHTEMMRKPAVAIAHWFVMLGFIIGSLVWFEAYIQTFDPAGGWPLLSSWSIYHFLEEVLAIGTVAGITFLFALRLSIGGRKRLARFYGSNSIAAFFVEAVVFIEGAGMLLVKAGKIATYGHATWADFLTRHIATLLPASPNLVSIFALVKLLSGMVWLVVIALNLRWGVAWHRFLAFFNIFFRRNIDSKALGGLPTIDLEESVGVGTLEDAPWKMLLDATTCTECGRCQEQCPAWHTEKPLSPKMLMTDLRDAAIGGSLGPIVGDVISEDVLWSCTNCGACVEQCPVDIEHLDHVSAMRRFQVLAESQFPSELTSLFKNLETKGNPWGRNARERATWIEEARRDGLEVPVISEGVEEFEYLFWVGCAGAFDDEARKTTRAVVELLHTAGVKFAVLSKDETCTGDPARRAGNEFLFQMLATENVETLNAAFEGMPRRKIITTCPHCFNTLLNEYPDFDGHFEVFHHTQLLNRLVREGLLKPVPRSAENRKPITYHDPCFLGRHNKVFDPPRELLGVSGVQLQEMPRNKNEGFCCGAGGARMFMEETIGTRINENRAAEAVGTGAEEIATGCPFCNTMLTTGVKTQESRPAVKDVAQMLRDAVLIDGQLPPRHEPAFLDEPMRRKTEKPQTPPTPESATQSKPAPAVPAPSGVTPPAPAAPPVPGGATPPAPGGATPPAPGKATPPAPGGATPPAPGGATPPAPGKATSPAPGGATPTAPGKATPPAPGGATPPAPGKATPPAPPVPPAPGGATPPAPAAPPAPGGATPPAPGKATPPAPGGATPPAPGKATPPAPGNATPPAPGKATPPAPGSATPPAPGKATPPAPPVPPAPGGATPPAPGKATPPAPGGAKPPAPPVPPAPGVATPPAPGNATPPAPSKATPPAPGSATPPAPGKATPPAPPVPPAPGGATPPAPGKATPPAPGGAKPPAPPVPPAPGVATPPAPGNATPPAPSKATPPAPGSATPPAPPAPPAPGNATPPAPGKATPPAPGNATPPAPPVPPAPTLNQQQEEEND